jgi:DNA repair protein RadC
VHEGHRQRLLQKLKDGSNLYEHELLEILLYNAYPRIDTNPIAHNLLERFSSIHACLSASPEELALVEGVGEQTALYLACIGKCLEYRNQSDSFSCVKNYSQMHQFAVARLKGLDYEVLEFYFVDKLGKILRVCHYTQKDLESVALQVTELGKLISVTKAYGMFCAHNHVVGATKPSSADNDFTKKCQLLCSIHGLNFYDHIITNKNGNFYSYFLDGKIDEIKKNYSVNSIFCPEK